MQITLQIENGTWFLVGLRLHQVRRSHSSSTAVLGKKSEKQPDHFKNVQVKRRLSDRFKAV
jgi:hypothetical protein